jgi:acyl carrier protein phosphodiesterase
MAAKKYPVVMNYLAHAYLSFMHEEILVGNLISDFVKGRKKFDYEAGVQKGMSLHRSIDTFTDTHPVTKEAKKYFKTAVGLYAGAFVDVVYDHFLAIDTVSWEQQSLHSFAAFVYKTLDNNYRFLPQKLQLMLPYMKNQDWLYNYRFEWGIERSFEGLARRAIYLDNPVEAYEKFVGHYSELKELSGIFIPDVKKFASAGFQQLLNT